jgi:Signal transduction histidine kinase
MKKTILRYWHAGLLAAAAVLLVLSIITGSRAGWRAYERLTWVNETYRVLEATSRAASLIKDAELDQRAFLISGASIYRDSYFSSEAAVRSHLTALEKLVETSPRQRERSLQLSRLVEARLATLRASVEEYGGGEDRQVGVVGLRQMAEIDALVRVIHAEETALLEHRENIMRRELWTTALMIVLSGGMALVLGANSFTLMRRALIALKREAELLRAKEQAEQSDREKSEFLANMSHEIRTPMNAVLGFAELLRGIATTPKQIQYVDAINTSGKALLSMINDILDLSKIEAGRLDLSFKPMSLRAVFGNIATIFEHQAEERGLDLSFDVDESVPPSISFDAVRLRQILFNVVGNALKFTPQGFVKVRAWSRLTEGDETTLTLYIQISDTGIGIAPEHHELIFEPFRQVRATESPYAGTGLGLGITRRLTGLLGGKLSLESEVGKGSVFSFEFPRVPLSSEMPDDEESIAASKDLDRLRPSLLLVVDDLSINRDLMQGYFEGTKHRLLYASTGEEGVAMAKKFQPDLVFMDLRMPDMDGDTARRKIKEDEATATIPVVAISASSSPAEEDALRDQFEGFMRKPITRDALYATLEELLPVVPRTRGTTSPLVVSSEAAPPMVAGSWRELVKRLRALETDTWPRLSKSMGMREMESFARNLLDEAECEQCAPLSEYARKLLAEVETIDIHAQEKTMKKFPTLVAEIARLAGGAESL